MVVLGIVVVAGSALWHPAPPAALRPVAEPSAAVTPRISARHRPRPTAEPALVYVVGAVRRPGLYRIGAGARVDDAVRAAGGLLSGADPAGVNLAAYASDGDEIVVPVFGASVRAASAGKRLRTPRSRSNKTHGIVDVNSASAQTLASVPGIGATIAARIVQVREDEGAFTTFDQLLDVAGITESRLERARPYLRL